MALEKPALIFDLDGTLTDSKPGILGCLRQVIDARGLGDCGPLDRFIGPPVEEWMTDLLPGATQQEHTAMASDYRACYDREGWRNNSVYAGIREMLVELRAQGHPLYVCTSKHEHFAVRILEAFDLADSFLGIYGDKAEYASHSKVDLLDRVVNERSLDRATSWMVGDRSFDIEAAHANHLRCVAAAWGYGTAHEWAQADAIVHTPADVARVIAGKG